MVKITERRIVVQEWYETELNKNGWDSNGWIFKDSREQIDHTWNITDHLDSDKHYNPILGVAEREIEIF